MIKFWSYHNLIILNKFKKNEIYKLRKLINSLKTSRVLLQSLDAYESILNEIKI